jgi:hypothetical protein
MNRYGLNTSSSSSLSDSSFTGVVGSSLGVVDSCALSSRSAGENKFFDGDTTACILLSVDADAPPPLGGLYISIVGGPLTRARRENQDDRSVAQDRSSKSYAHSPTIFELIDINVKAVRLGLPGRGSSSSHGFGLARRTP